MFKVTHPGEPWESGWEPTLLSLCCMAMGAWKGVTVGTGGGLSPAKRGTATQLQMTALQKFMPTGSMELHMKSSNFLKLAIN